MIEVASEADAAARALTKRKGSRKPAVFPRREPAGKVVMEYLFSGNGNGNLDRNNTRIGSPGTYGRGPARVGRKSGVDDDRSRHAFVLNRVSAEVFHAGEAENRRVRHRRGGKSLGLI